MPTHAYKCFVLICLTLAANLLHAATVNDLTYVNHGTHIEITDCDENATGDLVIPDTIEGLPVTVVGDSAFENVDSLNSIKMGSITSLNSYIYASESIEILHWGTLLMEDDNTIADTADITLNGGTLSVSGNHESINSTTLSSDSIIDLGTSEPFTYTSESLETQPLLIYNWTDTPMDSSNGELTGNNALTADNLEEIVFYSDSGATEPTPEAAPVSSPLTYKNHITHIEITDCDTAAMGDLVIPSTIEGLPVTVIGDWAFYNCTSLTSITIPSSVTSIGVEAFLDCTSLTNITLPNSVTSIRYQAFRNCYSLTSITIPDSVTYIDYQTFYNCASLTSITIPDSVTYIGYKAFRSCASLTSITIPDSVTYIGDYAFEYCSSLTSVTIPNSVTSIGNYTFKNCTSLTSITIPNNSVTSIGDNAFENCISLTSITLPNSVTSIGDNAFENCSSLTSITIPSSVTSIGRYAFWLCTSLTSITLPNSVTSIGDNAFASCTSLSSITIPSSITSIDYGAFASCTALTSITIPSSITSIGNGAFSGCTSLTSAIFEGDAPSSFGNFVFSNTHADFTVYYYSGATGFTSPTWNGYGTEPVSTTGTLGDLTYKNYSTHIEITDCDTAAMGELVIPPSIEGLPVTMIGASAFHSCTSLTSITIPNSVTSVGRNAFTECTYLTNITIPSSVTSIGVEAFYYCTSLTSITIPDSVTSIWGWAFYDCRSLTSAIFEGNMPSIFNSNAFSNAHADFTVYYYEGATGFTSPMWEGYTSVSMGTATPTKGWLVAQGISHGTDVTTDSNGDGVSLLAEYALGLSPSENNAANMPQPVFNNDKLELTFYAGASDITYTVKCSTDLINWTTAGITLSAPDSDGNVTASIPVTDGEHFMNITFTEN